MAEEDDSLNGFNDWEHLQSSSPSSSSSSSSSRHLLHHTQSSDDDLSVFPPFNHEGLPLLFPPPPLHHPTPNPPRPPPPLNPRINAAPPRPSSSSTNPPLPTSTSRLGQWFLFALRLFNSKAILIFNSLRSFGAFSSRSPLGGMVTPVAIMLVLLLWVRRRRWRRKLLRINEDRIEHLRNLIKEKDEKIVQLLDQIAQLNKVLLARYKVPVVRTW
ncbi:hypothetical protein Dimus_004937 [Dionaea muscipula]